MAYPKERENVEYMQYLERHDLGEEEGPRLSKENWRKKREDDLKESLREQSPAKTSILQK